MSFLSSTYPDRPLRLSDITGAVERKENAKGYQGDNFSSRKTFIKVEADGSATKLVLVEGEDGVRVRSEQHHFAHENLSSTFVTLRGVRSSTVHLSLAIPASWSEEKLNAIASRAVKEAVSKEILQDQQNAQQNVAESGVLGATQLDQTVSRRSHTGQRQSNMVTEESASPSSCPRKPTVTPGRIAAASAPSSHGSKRTAEEDVHQDSNKRQRADHDATPQKEAQVRQGDGRSGPDWYYSILTQDPTISKAKKRRLQDLLFERIGPSWTLSVKYRTFS